MDEIKKLPLTFTGRGEVGKIEFTQIKANDKAFMYERSDGYFEVFKREVNIRFNCESYPQSNSFGVWAFCIKNRVDADIKFDELTNHKTTEI